MELALGLLILVVVGYVIYVRNTSDKAKPVNELPIKEEIKPESPATSATITEPPPAPWHTALPEGTKPLPIPNPLDVNNDGKVNMEDVKEAVKKTQARIKKAADVDGDGKVTKKDAKMAGTKVKEKAKTAVKKTSRAKRVVL